MPSEVQADTGRGKCEGKGRGRKKSLAHVPPFLEEKLNFLTACREKSQRFAPLHAAAQNSTAYSNDGDRVSLDEALVRKQEEKRSKA